MISAVDESLRQYLLGMTVSNLQETIQVPVFRLNTEDYVSRRTQLRAPLIGLGIYSILEDLSRSRRTSTIAKSSADKKSMKVQRYPQPIEVGYRINVVSPKEDYLIQLTQKLIIKCRTPFVLNIKYPVYSDGELEEIATVFESDLGSVSPNPIPGERGFSIEIRLVARTWIFHDSEQSCATFWNLAESSWSFTGDAEEVIDLLNE